MQDEGLGRRLWAGSKGWGVVLVLWWSTRRHLQSVLMEMVAYCNISLIHGYWLFRVRILIRVPMTRARIVLVEVVSAD